MTFTFVEKYITDCQQEYMVTMTLQSFVTLTFLISYYWKSVPTNFLEVHYNDL